MKKAAAKFSQKAMDRRLLAFVHQIDQEADKETPPVVYIQALEEIPDENLSGV